MMAASTALQQATKIARSAEHRAWKRAALSILAEADQAIAETRRRLRLRIARRAAARARQQ